MLNLHSLEFAMPISGAGEEAKDEPFASVGYPE